MCYFKSYLINFIKNNYLLLIVIIINIVGFTFIFINNNDLEKQNSLDNNTISMVTESSEEVIQQDKIHVDIKGYVKKPGVYELVDGSIVNDAIILAGGVKKGGTTTLINLSKKLKDGMVIYVASLNEVNKLKKDNILTTLEDKEVSSVKTILNDVKITKDESLGYVDSSETKVEEEIKDENNNIISNSNKVNINKATINDLTNISGIGESKAKSIISYREENGLFKSIEDIKNVTGIGEALFEKIKDYIEV